MLVPRCASCVHYIHAPKDTPRCMRYPVTDVLDANVKYLETSVARYEDFNLCGKEGRYYLEKLPVGHRVNQTQQR